MQRHPGCSRKVFGPIFVYLVLGIVVGDNCWRAQKAIFRQALVIGAGDDPTAGSSLFSRKRAIVDRLTVQIGVVGLRKAACP